MGQEIPGTAASSPWEAQKPSKCGSSVPSLTQVVSDCTVCSQDVCGSCWDATAPFAIQTFYTVLCRPRSTCQLTVPPARYNSIQQQEAGTTSPNNYLNCFQTHQVWETRSFFRRNKSTQALCVLLMNIHQSFNIIEPQNSQGQLRSTICSLYYVPVFLYYELQWFPYALTSAT